MKSLEERIADRVLEHEKILKAEHKLQNFLDRLIPALQSSDVITGSAYNDNAFVYVSVDSLEDFEEHTINRLSDHFKMNWKREIDDFEVTYSPESKLILNDYYIFLTIRATPTDSCKIVKVPTGKIVKISKYMEVEEAEYEYLVECSDDEELTND